ncbi:MAG: dUTP diphosphatase [Acidobacteria bacterium]|nr:dUTP diphosphatase [Acidobacteriota bacterium]
MIIPTTGDGRLPVRSSAAAAGADLFAAEDVVLAPGERRLVPTDLQVAIPPGHAGLVWPRSGLAFRHGIDTMAGVIDSDYRGEVRVLLVNHGREDFRIHRGDRIAQLLIQRVEPAVFVRVEELPASERGSGGFGSTGR